MQEFGVPAEQALAAKSALLRPGEASNALRAMNTHEVVAAWLHVVAGVFVAACVSMLWLAAAMLAPYFEGSFVPGLVAMFGRPVAVVLLVFAFVELVAAVALLRGRAWARGVLLGVSVLLVPIFPIGTAVALYSAWTFLVRPQASARIPAPAKIASNPPKEFP